MGVRVEAPARLHLDLVGIADSDAQAPSIPSKLVVIELTYTPEKR